MLAIPYLLLVLLLGDTVCKRYFPYVSLPHRVATGFIAGLLMSTWITYSGAAIFGDTSWPMLAGNIFFLLVVAFILRLCHKKPPIERPSTTIDPETTRFVRADWIVMLIFFCVAVVMMYGTFSMNEGNIRIAHHQSSDFGSTASIMQSFAIGHNFPTEYPHFTGDRIRYHFLFYFAAGNLEYLGLSPASANNTLSILTLLAMFTLVMTLGAVLFKSRLAGRIGAILFYFHGSLAFIPFYYANGSLAGVWDKLGTLRDFLSSGLPYRGEDWGVWSQVVYLNQRHLVSSIAIFLIVVVFLAIRHRERYEAEQAARPPATPEPAATAAVAQPETDSEESERDDAAARGDLAESEDGDILELNEASDAEDNPPAGFTADEPESASSTGIEDSEEVAEQGEDAEEDGEFSEGEAEESGPVSSADAVTPNPATAARPLPALSWARLAPFIFAGVLLGLMPMWNGAVFAGAAGVLAVMFLLLPLRREMIAIAVASALVALPQVIFLKSGLSQPAGYSLFYFGYTISEPTVGKVLYYLMFTFGFKWVFIALALALGNKLQRRMIVAFTALVVMATCFQFSEEVLANHKFFNVWIVLMNVPVGFGVVKLWNLLPSPTVYLARAATVVLMFFITIGGVLDIFPVKNSFWVEYKFENDRLVDWVRQNTDPKAIFLSFRYVNHGILVAGRRLFYGHPYYAWGAGYNVTERDGVYRRMFESKDINEVYKLIKDNKIDYVAIDNQQRKGDFIKNINEKLFEAYFPVVFTDDEKKYDDLKIYKVPENLGPPNPTVSLDTSPSPSPGAAVNAFAGGEGNGYGQFARPRGVAVDSKGNFYVTDTGNDRVQKFDPTGAFVQAFGKSGNAQGEMKEPNGIAIDDAGNMYVTDAVNHKLLKLDPNGQVLNEWKGPEPGFYGPRDIAFGPDKKLYIVDQGRTRIVRFDPVSNDFKATGTSGTGDAQFNEPTGLAIGGGFIFVADSGNNRIQVFDMQMDFVRQWQVPEWDRYVWHYPDLVFDDQKKLLYVTNGWKKEVITYSPDGAPGAEKPQPAQPLDNPSAITLATTNKQRYLLVVNTANPRVTRIDLGGAPAQ